MARLVTTTCPKCGANVPLGASAERATCSYCQSVFVVKTAPAPATAPTRNRTGVVLAMLGVLALIATCGVGVALSLVRPDAPTTPEASPAPLAAPPLVVAELPPPARVEAAPPEPPPALHVQSDGPFFAVDVDGDGASELVTPFSEEGPARVGVFDAHTGAERVRTPELPRSELMAVVGTSVKRLVLSTPLGQLHAYDLLSGAEQWTTALADTALTLCTTQDGALHVRTADDRRLVLDLTTGRQSETRATCTPLQGLSRSGDDPRDRRDYGAPAHIEAYRCGSVRVMSSTNFVVPDACRGKVPNNLDGMVAHRIWKHGAGWLVFGVRAPGRYVPRLAYLQRGRVAWSLDVPAENPLDAEQGSTREAALSGTTLAVIYDTESDDKVWLAAFDMADGRRVFTQELASCARHSGLLATEDAFVVRCDTQLQVLSAADGAARATIGH